LRKQMSSSRCSWQYAQSPSRRSRTNAKRLSYRSRRRKNPGVPRWNSNESGINQSGVFGRAK
jgi:hypothetical protein